MGNEGRELLGVQVQFPGVVGRDRVIAEFGDRRLVAEMEKVFFSDAPNALGHSYAGLMRGPAGRRDLRDVIALLRTEPDTKRAVVTVCGQGKGRVPCINVVQFLVRGRAVQTVYFARGQDAFRKFYADGLCLAQMGQSVARGVGLPMGGVTGFIASSHVYDTDLPAIAELRVRARRYLRPRPRKGAV
jgi:thymidylate synthase